MSVGGPYGLPFATRQARAAGRTTPAPDHLFAGRVLRVPSPSAEARLRQRLAHPRRRTTIKASRPWSVPSTTPEKTSDPPRLGPQSHARAPQPARTTAARQPDTATPSRERQSTTTATAFPATLKRPRPVRNRDTHPYRFPSGEPVAARTAEAGQHTSGTPFTLGVDRGVNGRVNASVNGPCDFVAMIERNRRPGRKPDRKRDSGGTGTWSSSAMPASPTTTALVASLPRIDLGGCRRWRYARGGVRR